MYPRETGGSLSPVHQSVSQALNVKIKKINLRSIVWHSLVGLFTKGDYFMFSLVRKHPSNYKQLHDVCLSVCLCTDNRQSQNVSHKRLVTECYSHFFNVTLPHVCHTPLNQSHTSMLVTLLHVRQTSPCQSQSSMLVTLLHVSLTTPCQSQFSMLITLLHTTPSQSHYSMLVTLLHVSHTALCQSQFFMLIILLHVTHTTPCQSHS